MSPGLSGQADRSARSATVPMQGDPLGGQSPAGGLIPRRTSTPAAARTAKTTMDISGYALETLWEGGEFALSRGRPPDASASVLVRAPVADRPAPATLQRLEHEYSLAAELDPRWAVRPLALARHAGRTVLVLEDPGGEPLDRLLSPSLELTRFLRVALGLATALGQVHRRGLLHKDLQPANVLVDATDRVWLTGFGIASRLPRERV